MIDMQEYLKKMEDAINDVKEFAQSKMEGLDEPTKAKIQAISDATAKVIVEAKAKVEDAAKNVQDDEKLNAFLNKVMIKVQEASDFTKTKISALIPEKEKLEEIEKQISDSLDSVIDNENVQNVIKGFQKITDDVQGYLNKPETKAKINKAKLATLNAAEKGMAKLRDILKVDEDEEAEKIVIEDDDQDLK